MSLKFLLHQEVSDGLLKWQGSGHTKAICTESPPRYTSVAIFYMYNKGNQILMEGLVCSFRIRISPYICPQVVHQKSPWN